MMQDCKVSKRIRKKNIHYKCKYINFSLKKLPLLIRDQLFPNSKEITESVAAYMAIKKLDSIKLNSPNVVVYVIGDGHTPRTATTIASSSNFTVHSIDPLLKNKKFKHCEKKKWFKRLQIHKIKSEDFTSIEKNCELSIVVAVHSHAPFEEFWSKIPDPKVGIAIPCCFKHEIKNNQPVLKYHDEFILSPKNEVIIWKSP
jgi:hypothetical protein